VPNQAYSLLLRTIPWVAVLLLLAACDPPHEPDGMATEHEIRGQPSDKNEESLPAARRRDPVPPPKDLTKHIEGVFSVEGKPVDKADALLFDEVGGIGATPTVNGRFQIALPDDFQKGWIVAVLREPVVGRIAMAVSADSGPVVLNLQKQDILTLTGRTTPEADRDVFMNSKVELSVGWYSEVSGLPQEMQSAYTEYAATTLVTLSHIPLEDYPFHVNFLAGRVMLLISNSQSRWDTVEKGFVSLGIQWEGEEETSIVGDHLLDGDTSVTFILFTRDQK